MHKILVSVGIVDDDLDMEREDKERKRKQYLETGLCFANEDKEADHVFNLISKRILKKMDLWEELRAQMRPDFIFFETMDEKQKKRALRHLVNNLQDISYNDWSEIPILLTRGHYARSPKGFLVFPYNFKVPQLIQYINENLPKIKVERANIRDKIKDDMKLTPAMRDLLSDKEAQQAAAGSSTAKSAHFYKDLSSFTKQNFNTDLDDTLSIIEENNRQQHKQYKKSAKHWYNQH